MKNQHAFAGIFVSLVLAISGIQTAPAQLPTLDNAPWLGYFAGYKGSRFQFGITSQGELIFNPITNGLPGGQLAIDIFPCIQETLPNGKIVTKKLIPESLETTDSPSDKFEKAVFRGKVTGDASFEVTVEQKRGMIFIGGRVLDPGTLKNPLRFNLATKMPCFYISELRKAKMNEGKEVNKKGQKNDQKTFQKKLEDDSLTLKFVDGKREKKPLGENVDMSSKEISGPGIAELTIECETYKGRKIQFTASPDNSSITLSNPKAAPIYMGFWVNWSPDPAKDPEGKARLAISVR